MDQLDQLLNLFIFPHAKTKDSQAQNTEAAFNAEQDGDEIQLSKQQMCALRVSAWKGSEDAISTLKDLGEPVAYVFQVAEVKQQCCAGAGDGDGDGAGV